jgi:hypothetical protein
MQVIYPTISCKTFSCQHYFLPAFISSSPSDKNAKKYILLQIVLLLFCLIVNILAKKNETKCFYIKGWVTRTVFAKFAKILARKFCKSNDILSNLDIHPKMGVWKYPS